MLIYLSISEYDSTANIFSSAWPWLFPGGIGDLYDEERGGIKDMSGPVKNLHSYARHLMQYCDGRFQEDQMFMLYLSNIIQRHENNNKGGFLNSDKNWFGSNPPSVEELKEQIRNGDFTFISKLRYFSAEIKGSDGYWRKKTSELRSWIDYHVSKSHGPPTHFITLTCAENWWPDLREMYTTLENHKENILDGNNSSVKQHNKSSGRKRKRKSVDVNCRQSELLKKANYRAMCKAARKYPHYVNQYFMHRAKVFMDGFAREVMDLEYYWGRVEFASGRGQIHLHILGIAKNKAYLLDFYKAETEEDKILVMQNYAEEHLGLTANIELDDKHQKFNAEVRSESITTHSPLGAHFSECMDIDLDHRHLVQDCMHHSCTEYCLGDADIEGIKLRTCCFGFGTEITSNHGDTPGKAHQSETTIELDHRGVENLLLPREKSRHIVQHSRTMLQAWRANADVQLLVYRSNPDIPDVSEIEAVSKYCTSYTGKTNQTTKQEISTIQNVIIR